MFDRKHEQDDWGCDYCRNDGNLVDGRCPKCDVEYPDEQDRREDALRKLQRLGQEADNAE